MCCGNKSMQISAAIIEKLILLFMSLNRHIVLRVSEFFFNIIRWI